LSSFERRVSKKGGARSPSKSANLSGQAGWHKRPGRSTFMDAGCRR
jgi:hypothetical protein